MTWILLAACNGSESDGASPSLRVESTLIFDGVDIGTDAPPVERVLVENIGSGTLFVDVPYFADDGAFSVPGESVALEPMQTQGYDVTFDPRAPFVHEASLVFESNDPAGPRVVDVRGEGFAPVLDVSTSPIDFGMPDVGCSVELGLEMHNRGNELLVVNPSIEDTTEFGVPNPHGGIEIEPGVSLTIQMAYQPVDGIADVATLTLETNDPLQPETVIQVTGAGQQLRTRADVFEMKPRETDIVFVVDNSETMDTEQPQLVDNIGAFVEALDDAAADYRIGVITTDTSGLRGSVVTPGDPLAMLADQVEAGTGGSGTTRGLQMLYNCVLNDCSESAGFLRDDALFAAIIVSDGPDTSALTPEAYVEYFWTLKDDPDLVRVNLFAGAFPVPTCSTCDSTGFGYDEAVELSGGVYHDICTKDWDVALRSLAESSLGEPGSFALSADPAVDTIVVDVDGVEWKTGWTYTGHVADGGTNEVVFDLETLPPVGVDIEVRYTIAAVCE